MQQESLNKNDNHSLDLLRGLFAFNTEHWVTVRGLPSRIKYIPLSIREKINLSSQYEHIEDERERTTKIIKKQCLRMLSKAGYEDVDEIETLPTSTVISIYNAIIEDISLLKSKIESYCEENRTQPLKPSKRQPHKLDSLVNIVLVCKEAHLSLHEISEYDEITLFCILMGLGEMGTRESNEYEKNKSGD